MSSEDDYYNDRYDYRRSSKRPRRRASSPRRHRHLGFDHYHRKSRRGKAIYSQFAPRLAGLVILLVFILYEVFVFNGAATSKPIAANRSETSHTRQSSVPTPSPVGVDVKPQPYQKLPSHASPPPPNSSSPNSTAHDSQPPTSGSRNPLPSTSVAAEAAPSSSSNDTIASKSAVSNSLPSEPKTKLMRLPESAIQMETKAADEDPETQTDIMSNRSPSQNTGDSSGTSLSGDQQSLSKTTFSRDKGAEPGAGENFWNWFQETKGGDDKGVSKSLPCPEESKRLCQMFYKYLRKYKIRRIFDVSCEKNFEWMRGILKKVGNELWGFKYYCSLWSGQNAENARKKLEGLPFVVFNNEMWWREGFAPDTELLFAWDTLPHLAYGRVWNFFVKARKQDIKYILVDNYPGILNDPSPKRDFLNLRKHPFRFPSAKEVAQNVTEPGETAKRQLLLYETSMLPDNLQ